MSEEGAEETGNRFIDWIRTEKKDICTSNHRYQWYFHPRKRERKKLRKRPSLIISCYWEIQGLTFLRCLVWSTTPPIPLRKPLLSMLLSPHIPPSCTPPFHRCTEEEFRSWRTNTRERIPTCTPPQRDPNPTTLPPHPSACPPPNTPKCWNWTCLTVSTGEEVTATPPWAPPSTTAGGKFWAQVVALIPAPLLHIPENSPCCVGDRNRCQRVEHVR